MTFALICGVLAVLLGAWRQASGVYELALESNCPKIWKYKTIKIATWIVTALLSLIFAIVMAKWISLNVGDFIGRFSFGAILAARWIASMLIGLFPANTKCDKNGIAPY